MKAKSNDNVKVHYTGKLESGKVFDSSVGREPLSFTVGDKRMIRGFSNAVRDMEVNQKKSILIPYDEAYGPHKPELVHEIIRSEVPDHIDPIVGQKLMASIDQGEIQVTVTEVTHEKIVIDGNHELAGKNLIFEIELVEIGEK